MPTGACSSLANQLVGLYHVDLLAVLGADAGRRAPVIFVETFFSSFQGFIAEVVLFQALAVLLDIFCQVLGCFVVREANDEFVFLPEGNQLLLELFDFDANGLRLGMPQPSANTKVGTRKTHNTGHNHANKRAFFTARTPDRGGNKARYAADRSKTPYACKGRFLQSSESH